MGMRPPRPAASPRIDLGPCGLLGRIAGLVGADPDRIAEADELPHRLAGLWHTGAPRGVVATDLCQRVRERYGQQALRHALRQLRGGSSQRGLVAVASEHVILQRAPVRVVTRLVVGEDRVEPDVSSRAPIDGTERLRDGELRLEVVRLVRHVAEGRLGQPPGIGAVPLRLRHHGDVVDAAVLDLRKQHAALSIQAIAERYVVAEDVAHTDTPEELVARLPRDLGGEPAQALLSALPRHLAGGHPDRRAVRLDAGGDEPALLRTDRL